LTFNRIRALNRVMATLRFTSVLHILPLQGMGAYTLNASSFTRI